MVELKYYKPNEFACKCGCGLNNASSDLIEMIERLCELCGRKIPINSFVRCQIHNHNIGGSPTSSHLSGLAVDLSITTSSDRFNILERIFLVGFKRIEVRNTWIHIDIDKSKVQKVLWLD